MVLFTLAPLRGAEVVQVNQAMCETVGHSAAQLRASGFRDVLHPDDSVAAVEELERLLTGERESVQLELRCVHATGRTVWVSASVSLLRAAAGERRLAIAQVQDVTEHRMVAEELIHQALHDPVTGLGNRRSLLGDLDLRLLEATRARPLLLVLFDLDGFKGYNDTYGHPAGDALLLRLANRLEAAVEGRATAYHVGGDEFCVLTLTGVADRDSIPALAAAALSEDANGFTVTASHGAVLLPEEAATAIDALREADRRMYAHKRAAGNAGGVVLRLADRRTPG